LKSEIVLSVSPQSGLNFIEQLQIASNGSCSKENRPYLVGVNENAKQSLLTRPNCKMWNCEACASNNARVWIAKIINGINRIGGEWSFLTLTAHRHHRKNKSVANLRQGWKKFYNRILAVLGKNAENLYYCKVWEQHADGGFHLHILISVCFGTRWAKDNAAGCGLGFQADWRKIDNAGQVAGYVSKYTLKNSTIARGDIQWPTGLRRIETSRNWPILERLEQETTWGWIVHSTRTGQLISANEHYRRGFDIIDLVKE
jgi:hypothetical protein